MIKKGTKDKITGTLIHMLRFSLIEDFRESY